MRAASCVKYVNYSRANQIESNDATSTELVSYTVVADRVPRSQGFWVELEPFFVRLRLLLLIVLYYFSFTYYCINMLFLRNPKVILTLLVFIIFLSMRTGSRRMRSSRTRTRSRKPRTRKTTRTTGSRTRTRRMTMRSSKIELLGGGGQRGG